MKFKSSYLLFIVTIILITRYIVFLLFPFLSGDGPWSLSPVFSYINGLNDQSIFAHDFLGNIFTVHFIDFIYSQWFKTFGISTYSFISLSFLIIIATISIWFYIAKIIDRKALIYLLISGYVISPYTYGFRPENMVILLISMVILVLIKPINKNLKLVLIATLTVISGLIHHIGGLFCVLISLYYLIFVVKNYFNILIFCVLGILLSILFTKGEIINYLLLPLKFKSEVGNHLSGIDFSSVIKYLIYSGPIPALIIFLNRKNLIMIDLIFLIFIIFCFSMFGRSYYVVYLFTVALFFTAIKNDKQIQIKAIEFTGVLLVSTYSFLFLFFIPVLLIIVSPKTNKTWRDVIDVTEKEKVNWYLENKYFVPAQLTLEVANRTNSRLLYPFMLHNDGVQAVKNKIFYVTSKEQLKWIIKNFNTNNKHIIISELVPENEGHIVISSIYRFKIKRAAPIGLWKINFVD